MADEPDALAEAHDPAQGAAPRPPREEEEEEARGRALLREALALYLVAFALVLALALLGLGVGFVAANLYALVAAVFVGLPYWWMGKEELDPERFGLSTRRLGRNIAWGLAATALTVAPFAVGQYIWEVEVRGQQWRWDTDNWRRWPAHIEGQPTGWGRQRPGVWVWTERGELTVGMRADPEARYRVVLEASSPFRPRVRERSGLMLRALGPDGRRTLSQAPARRWELYPPPGRRRTRARLPRHGAPSDLTLRLKPEPDAARPAPAPRVGAGAEPQQDEATPLELERSWTWIALWLITQVFFIALPEEYFYRGYLQTRLAQGLAARRRARGGPDAPRRLWLITPSNALTSLLFGLGHLLIPVGGALLANRIAVLFPSLLFGWLRERTGTITAPVVYHAGCNMMVIVLAVHYT